MGALTDASEQVKGDMRVVKPAGRRNRQEEGWRVPLRTGRPGSIPISATLMMHTPAPDDKGVAET
jgi:hypothetical protein